MHLSLESRSFRNGAITVSDSNQERILLSSAAVDSSVSGGTVSFDVKIKLAEMGAEESSSDAEAAFVVKGSLDNIKLTAKKDISVTKGFNSLDLRVDSDVNFDVSFEGEAWAKFGYFSEAWEEVEEQEFSLLGNDVTLTGLSSEDKIGKFPLAGLVWAAPCPSLCPVSVGSTATPLNQAKAMGVILWVYLTLDGELSLEDGSFTLVHLNPAGLSVGIKKEPDENLQLIGSLERNSGSGRLIEVLKLNGSLNAQVEAGLSLDTDFFAFGVRAANAGIDLVALYQLQVSGEIGYGTDGLSLPWSWDGRACFQSSIGAGAVFRGAAKFGIETDAFGWKTSVNYEYETQIPTDDEMDEPGWHHGIWYTEWGVDKCIGDPEIMQTPLSGPPGTTFNQSGTGFTPGTTGIMHFRKPDGTEYPTMQQAMDSTGHFDISYTAPMDKEPGEYTWWVIDGPTGVSSNEVTYIIEETGVDPTIAQTPMSGPPGTTFAQWGTGFTPNSTATMHFRKPDGTEYPTMQQSMDSTGHFDITYTAPTNKEPGNYTWWVVDGPTGISSNQVTYTIEGTGVNPTIAQTPMSAPAGTTFAQWGTGFTPNSTGTMHFRKPDGTEYPTMQQAMDSTGHFDITYTAPTSKAPGNYTWWVIDGPTGISSNQVTYTITSP